MKIMAYYPKGGVDLFLKDRTNETIAYDMILFEDYDKTKKIGDLVDELSNEINDWLKRNDARVKEDNIHTIIDKTVPLIQASTR